MGKPANIRAKKSPIMMAAFMLGLQGKQVLLFWKKRSKKLLFLGRVPLPASCLAKPTAWNDQKVFLVLFVHKKNTLIYPLARYVSGAKAANSPPAITSSVAAMISAVTAPS